MSTNSYTGSVNTNGEYKTVAEVTGFSFITDNKYTMQVQNGAYIKIADAEFHVANEKFSYKATSDDLYIKTNDLGCILTILENE